MQTWRWSRWRASTSRDDRGQVQDAAVATAVWPQATSHCLAVPVIVAVMM
jgi:hypothetical protein